MLKPSNKKPRFPWLLAILTAIMGALLVGGGTFVIGTIIIRAIALMQS